MNELEFQNSTKQFGLRIIRVVAALPRNPVADSIGRQLLRSGTSVGANYRAACRGKSARDVISKLGTVEEEADESCYWMEVLIESGAIQERLLAELLNESNEIVAMTVASIKTLRRNNSERTAPRNPKSKIANPQL